MNNKLFCWLYLYLLFLVPLCCGTVCTKSATSVADTLLSQDPSLSLSKKDLVRAINFIEKIHNSQKNKDRWRYSEKNTSLPCVIEKCPEMDGYLIRELYQKDKIGSGRSKVVRRAIFYSADPKIVVDCDSHRAGKREINVLRQLKGCPGIVPFLGSIQWEENRHSIYLEYFPKGSLRDQLKHKAKFSKEQIIKIALDTSSAVQLLHSKNLIYGDCHSGNILLRSQTDTSIEAVLTDFGDTQDVDSAKSAFPHKRPPELLVQPLKQIDRHLTDVYAIGFVLYYLVWEKDIPWFGLIGKKGLKNNTLSHKEKNDCYSKIVSLYEKDKQKKIGSFKPLIVSFEQFQATIFQMLHYDPKKRPSVDEVVERFRVLLEQERAEIAQQNLNPSCALFLLQAGCGKQSTSRCSSIR